MTRHVKKSGAHGTLYLYSITYTDPSDDCIGELKQRLYAYNIEHALDKFYSAIDADGWKALRVLRVVANSDGTPCQHEAIEHEASL